MQSLPPAVEFDHVRFMYADGTVGLEDLCLSIGAGEIFGLLGPNGAGKTTAFKVLTGLASPTTGRCLINGRPIVAEERAVYREVGYMPDLTDNYDDYTVTELLRFFGLCHGLSDVILDTRIADLLARFQLTDRRDKLLGTLSKGLKQKVCIARVMLHDPAILLLDEPSAGLDPGGRQLLRDVLRELAAKGRTILISSHILPELWGLCTTLGVLAGGRLVEYGRTAELMHKYQNPVARYELVIVEGMHHACNLLMSLHDTELRGYECVNERILCITHAGSDQRISELVELVVRTGARIIQFNRLEKDIETIYREIVDG